MGLAAAIEIGHLQVDVMEPDCLRIFDELTTRAPEPSSAFRRAGTSAHASAMWSIADPWLGAVEIRGEGNHQNGLEQPSQCVALPHDDRTPASLLLRSIDTKVRPPDLVTLQRGSSPSRAAAHSSSPASARARSSSACAASRVKSQRLGSGRRTTMGATRSPDRSGSGDTGRRRPFSLIASTGRMSPRITSRGLGGRGQPNGSRSNEPAAVSSAEVAMCGEKAIH